jgi:hypothetical protein
VPVDGADVRSPPRQILLVCAALAALALPLGVAARSTRKRVPIALGALLLLAAPFVPRLFPAKTVARPDYFTTAASLGPYGLELGVSPDAPGTNTIDLLVTDRSGRRADLARLDVTAAHARRRPLRFRPDRLAPGHFTIDFARLPAPGVWRLRVAARRFARTIPVPIPPTSSAKPARAASSSRAAIRARGRGIRRPTRAP